MAETFHLGFDIDSAPLKSAAIEGQKAADAIGKLGDAEQKLAQQSQAAATSQKTLQNELKQTGDAADRTGKQTQKVLPADANQKAQAFADALRRAQAAMGEMSQAAGGLSGVLGAGGGAGLGSAMSNVVGMVGRFASALGPTGMVIGAVTVGFGVLGKQVWDTATTLAKAADEYTQMEARFKNALGTMSAARDSMRAIYETTQQTGLGFQAAAESFNRLARNAEALGASRAQILQLSETIQKLGAVSGASRGEIASGMIQLSQALASGRLNGDELRSIMENMPALAKAIADGLGVSVGQIRAMGAAGELTGSKVFEAILKASAKANEEFANLPDTVERANQRVADSWEKLLALMGQRWNASDLVRDSTNWLNRLINGAAESMKPKTPAERITALEAQRDQIANSIYRGTFGANTDERVAAINAQIEEIRQQGMAAVAEEGKEREKKEFDQNFSKVRQGIEMGATQFDDWFKKSKTARESVEQLENAIGMIEIRLKTGAGEQSERDFLPALRRQLANAKAEAADLAGALALAQRGLSDTQRADLIGGGGGGTSIVKSAIEQSRAAATKGGGSVESFIRLGIGQAVAGGDNRITTIERQTEQQRQLAAQIGLTRAEIIEMEIATAAANLRFDMFGKLKDPLIDGFLKKYTEALRAQRKETDETAAAQARLNSQVNVALQIIARTPGFSGRETAARFRAAQADRQRPGSGQNALDEFYAGEETQALGRIRSLDQNAAMNRAGIGRIGRDRELAVLEARIAQESDNIAPGQRDAFGDAMRREDASRFDAARDQEEANLRRQLNLAEQRYDLLGLYGEELRVQEALLNKRVQLEEQGLTAGDQQYDRQMEITEALARQQFAYERIKQRMDSMRRTVDEFADGMKNSFTSALEEAFSSGTKAGWEVFGKGMSGIIKKIGAEMIYEIAYRPFVEMTRNMMQTGLSKLLSSFGVNLLGMGGSPSVASTAGGTPLVGSFTPGPTYGAHGMAFGHAGIQAFAMGGVVNSPTMFAFANGGRLGVMGEAGPEAILPLTRGSNGKLGVQAAGGGGGDVTVVVNDMRSNTGAAPVETSSKRGPDGRRMISVLVRDEVRKQMRNGEYDRDMQTNFGNSRQIARL